MNPLATILAKKKISLPEMVAEVSEEKKQPTQHTAPLACPGCGSLLFWHSIYDREPHCINCEPDPPRGLYGGLIDRSPGGDTGPSSDGAKRKLTQPALTLAEFNRIYPRFPCELDRDRGHATTTATDHLAEDCCTRCNCREFRDTEIHGGRSTRRDCSRCGLTQGFPRWAGGDGAKVAVETHAPRLVDSDVGLVAKSPLLVASVAQATNHYPLVDPLAGLF